MLDKGAQRVMPRSKVMSTTIAINTIEEAVGVPFELERYCGTSFLLLCRLATSNYWVNATMLDAWMRKKYVAMENYYWSSSDSATVYLVLHIIESSQLVTR